VGEGWGGAVPLARAPAALAGAAARFLAVRGEGSAAPWHVRELAAPLLPPVPAHPGLPAPAPPLGYGAVPGGRHVPVPGGVLDRAVLAGLLATGADEVVVTPWHGVLVPGAAR
jgi:precorrin-3B synthase